MELDIEQPDFDSNPPSDLDCSLDSEVFEYLYEDLMFDECDSDNDDCGNKTTCAVENEDEETLTSELRKWKIVFGVGRDCTDALLTILKRRGLEVPKCTKTLMKSVDAVADLPKIEKMPPGRFINFGIENMLTRINNPSLRDINEIVITVSSDGMPLFRSSKSHLIPITMNVVGVENMPQVPIGIYHGAQKPLLKDYLKDYCTEVPRLLRDGVLVTSERIRKPFSVLFYGGDAPQRAWMAGVKGHTACNGCHMCDQVGKKVGRRLTFSTKKGNPRTDISFALRECIGHHQPEFLNELTPLEQIGTGMVSQIPLDSMHLIDRGVSAKTVRALWADDCVAMKVNDQIREEIEYKIFLERKCIPKDFPRKCRTFTELANWKATEFRLFTLYTSVVILRDSVSDEVYDHYLHLICGYRLLCTKNAQLNASTSDILFQRFVENYPAIYGEDRLSYNIHNLLHISECVERYGAVDEFSAYKNENYQMRLRKFIRKPTQILEQLRNRVMEMFEINEIVYEKGFLFGTQNKFPDCTKSYNGYRFDKFILKSGGADAYCQIFPDIKFQIEAFAEQNEVQVVIGRRFSRFEPFFTLPMNSEDVGIFQCGELSSEYETFPVAEIQNKFVRIPYKESSILIAMLHHL